MRTLRTIIRAVALVVILAAAAHSRDMAGKFGITPQLGLIIPAGEFMDRRGIGFKYGLELEYFLTNNVSLGLRLFHDDFPGAGGLVRPLSGFKHSENIWPIDGLGVQAKYYRAATPFTDVFGRISFVLCRMEFPIHKLPGWYWDYISDRETETSAGLEVGIGISRHLSRRFAFYGEIEYALLFTKGIRIEKEPAPPWYGYSCSYNTQMVAIKTGLTVYFGGTK